MAELLLLLALGLLIGAVLGGIGGGGAVLTVPALVYLVGQSAQEATSSSLVVVGLTALAGAATYLRSGRVRWGVGVLFAAVGVPAAWLGSLLNRRVDEEVLLLGFAAVMVVAALAMVTGAGSRRREPVRAAVGAVPAATGGAGVLAAPAVPAVPPSAQDGSAVPAGPPADSSWRRPPVLVTVAVASAAGLLTGFFGVGGGFVVVPALVLALRLPLQQAVGTSLVVVALNSGTALASRTAELHLSWSVVVPFALAAMAATLLGKRVADRLPARLLQLAFAALMVLVAAYTAVHTIAAGAT